MGKQIRCKEGKHFYNPDEHSKCPYCRQVTSPMKLDKTKGLNEPGQKSGSTVALPKGNDKVQDGKTRVVQPEKVVGWLVCVDGPEPKIGKDYRIYTGGNTIGREAHNTIQITGDMEISGDNHASIQYEHRESVFCIIATPGKSSVYVNGKHVRRDADITRNDIIEIGSTKLRFVPFCDEDFRWGDSGDSNA